jgi:hypothetical protein
VAADDDPEAVVAIANPASVSVTSCLRITVDFLSPSLCPVTEALFIDPPDRSTSECLLTGMASIVQVLCHGVRVRRRYGCAE